MEDFSQIYLTAQQLAALEKLDAGQQDRAEIDAEVFRRLKSLGFVTAAFSPAGSDVVRITEPGRSFLIFNRKRKNQLRVSWVRFWLPFILSAISIGISIYTRIIVG